MPLTNGFHHLDHATERLPFVPAGIDGAVGRDEAVAIGCRPVLHLGNVVAAEREPWLVIYPKPLVGEPAFDGGHLPADALAGDSGIDRVEFARWAYEIDEVDEGGPEGRLTLARSLAGPAER